MEFTPSLVGCVISSASHSFHMIRGSRECVINLPTTKLTDIVVGVGNCSGADVDKFEKFSLTPLDADEVDAPLIKECHANFECRLHDDALVDKYNFFIFEVVKAHDAATPKHPETLHYTGGERRRLAGYSATIQVGGLILFDVARQRAASHPAQQTFADSGKLKEGIHAGVAAINR
jgi:flavin reductase (DIM6/NTAB) family NADH-FMN oxidoreductase RutF